MDIKSLVRTIVPFTSTAQTAATKRRMETEGAAADRDANGRQEQGEEQRKRTFTDDETQEAIKYLEGLQGVKDNNLTVRLAQEEGVKVIFVEDPSGKIVRRIAESDFGVLLKSKAAPEARKSGNLLNRSA